MEAGVSVGLRAFSFLSFSVGVVFVSVGKQKEESTKRRDIADIYLSIIER